jgi:hypothetical protein
MQENFSIIGYVDMEHYDGSMNLIGKYHFDNLIVTQGKNYITSRMLGTSKPVISHIGLGTGTTSAALSDTSLTTQLGSRLPLDSSDGTTSQQIVYSIQLNPGTATGVLTEAGLFNSATIGIGDMLSHLVFSPVTKGVDDTIIINWTVAVV